MEALLESLNVMDHVMAFTLGLPRILLVMIVLPFMASGILTGSLKFAVGFSIYLLLHPLILDALSFEEHGTLLFLHIFVILLKESILGVLIGLLVGILFWAIQSAGFFIDNQRGLTQAMGADPLSGEQTSPLGSFFFQGIVYIFFSGGAFLVFLQFLYTSYLVYPVTELLPMSAFARSDLSLLIAEQVVYLMELMLLFSAPIVVACLLTDISLGLVNRFASQLNVYILAMPIKSGITSFLIIFYFGLMATSFMPIINQGFTHVLHKLGLVL